MPSTALVTVVPLMSPVSPISMVTLAVGIDGRTLVMLPTVSNRMSSNQMV